MGNEQKPRFGVPYAPVCQKCWAAKICPVCGEHITTVDRKDFESFSGLEYAEHFKAEHGAAWEAGELDSRDAMPFSQATTGC